MLLAAADFNPHALLTYALGSSREASQSEAAAAAGAGGGAMLKHALSRVSACQCMLCSNLQSISHAVSPSLMY